MRDMLSTTFWVNVPPTVLTPMSIWLLKVEQVRPYVLQKAIDIEHVDPCLRIFQREPFLDHGRANQVSETNASRARSEKQVLLIAQLRALDLGRVDHPCQDDPRGALHIVVV